MKMGGGILGKAESHKFGYGAMVKCLVFAIVVLSVLNPAILPRSLFLRQNSSKKLPIFEHGNRGRTKLSMRLLAKELSQDEMVAIGYEASKLSHENKEQEMRVENEPITRIDVAIPPFNLEEKTETNGPGNDISKSSLDEEGKLEYKELENSEGNELHTHSEETENKEKNPFIFLNEFETLGENKSIKEFDEKNSSGSSNEKQEQSHIITEITGKKSKLIYNYTNPRYNICTIEGDIRIIPNASTIFVISPLPLDPNTSTWKIKPYPRKWETRTMEAASEMTIQQLSDASLTSSCDVTHDVPAVIFSSARFMGNLFHDYTDMIYPFFLASHRYNGEVKLVVKDYVSKSMDKYTSYLTRLSRYPIINLDNETRVHCFSSVQIGLQNPGPLGYEFQNTQNDYSMQEFTQFIRESLSLKRNQVVPTKKPRLLILLRKWTRSIVNEQEVIALAKDIGFEVVTADSDRTADYPRIARIVNSCDILMGIHGAGLANMIYLPKNGTVLQIIPWGHLKWVGRYDYGDPPRGFGLKYTEYEITQEESTLIEKYPRDHPVFTDPESYHKQGWGAVYIHFLHEQSVKLDVNRFRVTLEEVFQSYQ